LSEFEANGFRGLWLPGRRLDGGFGVAIIAKRRFLVDMASATCVSADEVPSFVMAAEHRLPEDPMASSVAMAPEIALAKAKVDVIVYGHAHAPGGQPKRTFDVRVRIAGVLDRSLRIVGPRVAKWVAPKKKLTKKQRDKGEMQPYPTPTFGQAKTISSLPLTYEFAYGGSGALLIDEHLQEAAEKHQEEAQEAEARRERKQEIEAELKAEQEVAAEEIAEAKKAEAGGLAAVSDDQAREKFADAFEGGAGLERDGVRVLDAAELARLEAEGEEEVLVEASPMRFGDSVPERPRDAEEAPDEEGTSEAEEEAPARESGTAVLDLSEFEAFDELKGAIDATDAKRRRELRDRDGTLIARVDGMEEVALSDDAWIAEAQGGPAVEVAPEEESPFPMIPHLANPSGKGYCVSPMKEAVEGLELPCIEYPDRPLTPESFVRDLTTQDLQAIEPVAGFGPYGAGWFPRARFAGVLPWDLEAAEAGKAAALEAFDPEDPGDSAAIKAIEEMEIPIMRSVWFQEAHPEMQVEALKGDEEVFLDNFSPTGPIFFRLPGLHPTASIDLGEGAQPVLMHIDTLVIDAESHEAPSVTLLWRGWYPLEGLEVFDEVGSVEVRLGELDQAGWLDEAREAAARPKADGDGERLDEGALLEADADAVYRDEIHMRKATARDDVGVPKESGGTAIIDIREERALTDDAFFDRVQADKDAFEGAAEDKVAMAEKERDKALKKKAREMADAEFGIEGGEDEE
jgi:hypothetical protein